MHIFLLTIVHIVSLALKRCYYYYYYYYLRLKCIHKSSFLFIPFFKIVMCLFQGSEEDDSSDDEGGAEDNSLQVQYICININAKPY